MIMRYDPFRDMMTLQERMNRAFDDFLNRSGREPENAMVEWRPLADIFEDDNNVVISLDIPGMSRDAIHVSVENNVLTVKGDRLLEKEDRKKNYHRVERAFGSFSRAFSLPNTVNAEEIKASYVNGVLEISLSKREELKPRSIAVKVG